MSDSVSKKLGNRYDCGMEKSYENLLKRKDIDGRLYFLRFHGLRYFGFTGNHMVALSGWLK